jgi:signal peptidase II
VIAGAGRSRSAWITLLVATLLSVAADLGTKWAAFRYVADQPVVIRHIDVIRVTELDPRMASQLIPPHPPMTVVPKVLDLTLVLNPGAVFGTGPGRRWFFIGFTGVALAFGMWMFATWTRPRDNMAHIGIGLLIGGGLGNLYDRLTFGVVRDFLHPIPGMKWPMGWKLTSPDGEIWPYVSNVADALLLIGIGMLLVYLWRRDRVVGPAPAK